MRLPLPARLPSAALAVTCLLLLVWPLAWWAPLAEAGLLPWFGGRSLSVLGAVAGLWGTDAALALLVALFGIVLPYAKTLALLAVLLGRMPARHMPAVEALGKLSMADVFLIALYITVAKGVGVGWVETAWGLWLFTGCVLASLWAGRATRRIAAGAAPR